MLWRSSFTLSKITAVKGRYGKMLAKNLATFLGGFGVGLKRVFSLIWIRGIFPLGKNSLETILFCSK